MGTGDVRGVEGAMAVVDGVADRALSRSPSGERVSKLAPQHEERLMRAKMAEMPDRIATTSAVMLTGSIIYFHREKA